jgi:hypothetical protein
MTGQVTRKARTNLVPFQSTGGDLEDVLAELCGLLGDGARLELGHVYHDVGLERHGCFEVWDAVNSTWQETTVPRPVMLMDERELGGQT